MVRFDGWNEKGTEGARKEVEGRMKQESGKMKQEVGRDIYERGVKTRVCW